MNNMLIIINYYLDAVVVSILYDGIEQWFSDKGKLEKEGLVSLFLVCFLVIYLSVIPFLSNIQYLFIVFLLKGNILSFKFFKVNTNLNTSINSLIFCFRPYYV